MPPPEMAESTAPVGESLLVSLEGFEGPLDLLLDLARAQKVDLTQLSMVALVDQYLAVIEGARQIRLELAAEWLVMAAWLTWLKSRLLLPPENAAAEEGMEVADVLTARLRDLQGMRAAAGWLGARPQLGRDVFARGMPEDFTEIDRSRLALDLPGLVRAYLAAARRAAAGRVYRPPPPNVWTVQDALARLGAMLGRWPDWTSLERFLPEALVGRVQRRAALASTLVAGLELARDGAVALRQERPFGPILVAGRSGERSADG